MCRCRLSCLDQKRISKIRLQKRTRRVEQNSTQSNTSWLSILSKHMYNAQPLYNHQLPMCQSQSVTTHLIPLHGLTQLKHQKYGIYQRAMTLKEVVQASLLGKLCPEHWKHSTRWSLVSRCPSALIIFPLGFALHAFLTYFPQQPSHRIFLKDFPL